MTVKTSTSRVEARTAWTTSGGAYQQVPLEFEKLSASIVALSSGNADLRLNSAAIRMLLGDDNPSIQPAELLPALLVHSLRQQIELSMQPGRTQVKDMSLERPFGPNFCQIWGRVAGWLSEQGIEWRSHGWNFELSAQTGQRTGGDLITGLLAQRARMPERPLTGGSLVLKYQLDTARVTLTVEPRFGEADAHAVFASSNYHFQEPPPLSADLADEVGRRLWGDFASACENLFEE